MIGPRWFRCVLVVVVALSGACTAAAGVMEPGEGTEAAPADSAAAAPADSAATAPGDSTAAARRDSTIAATRADTTAVDRFVPTWNSSMKANDSELSLRSGATVQVIAPNGWMFFNTTRIEKKKFRLRDNEEINEELMNSASKFVPDLYSFNFRIGNSYMKKTLLGYARFGKDFVVDTDNASFDFVLRRRLLGARSSQISFTGDARRGPNDFKYDRTLTGGAGAYLRYGRGDALQVGGGFGTSRIREESEIGSMIRFDAMPSRIDTVRALVNYGAEKEKLLHLEYQRTDGVTRRVTLPRGNSLELLDDPEAAQEEEEHKMGQTLKMTSFVEPLSYVTADLSFEHNTSEQVNRIDTRLNNKSVDSKLRAMVSYLYADRGSMSFDLENGTSDVDYGTVSLGSYREKNKKIGMAIRQQLGDSLSVVLRGAVSLNQRFLKKYDVNPRDQDNMVYGVGGGLTSVPFRSVKTGVDFTFTRREMINIDKTLSGDNRIDYLYQFVPNISVKPAGWATVRQDYTLKFEETDFVYNEEGSTLNRTIGVETRADLSVLNPLRFAFIHEYRKRDTGSYLLRDGERKYGRTGENVDNDLELRLAYRPIEGFTLTSSSDFQIQETRRLKRDGAHTAVLSSNTFESGAFRVGFERKRSIGAGGQLDLTIQYVRRFGPTITALRREYWIVDAGLKFEF